MSIAATGSSGGFLIPLAVLSCSSLAFEVIAAITDSEVIDVTSASINVVNCKLDVTRLSCIPVAIDVVTAHQGESGTVAEPTDFSNNSGYRLNSYFSEDFNSAGNGATVYLSYDNFGRLVKKTNSSNSNAFIAYIYNINNQLVRINISGWSANVGIGLSSGVIEFNYNANGIVESLDYNNITYQYTYDSNNRVLRIENSEDSDDYIAITYQDGNANTYDNGFVVANLSYLSNNALSTAVAGPYTLNVSYDEKGITSWTDDIKASASFYDFSNFVYEQSSNCFAVTDAIRIVDFEAGFICGGAYTIKGK